MKKSFLEVQAPLKAVIDPTGILPSIEPYSELGEGESGLTAYTLFEGKFPIGSAMLHRTPSRFGIDTLKIEHLRVHVEDISAEALKAAELAILAMSFDNNCMLVSDDNGSTFPEVAMWRLFEAHGLATVEEKFIPRLELVDQECIWDGQAFASPALHG